MSEHHILNPRATWDDDLQDNPCPDYGFGAKLTNTRVSGKAPGGQPFTREVANTGHTFSLSWLNRSYKLTQMVKQFYEQHADGYFTLIDRDGGGRHYVGRFTGDFNRTDSGNDSWDIRDLTFEEVPGAPMLQYPNDWQRDSIAFPAFNDSGKQLAATSGTHWSTGSVPGFTTLVNSGLFNEFLAMEYRGYGFQLWMQCGAAFGSINVDVDGVFQKQISLTSGTSPAPQMVYQQAMLPLDLHRVKVVILNENQGASFCKLQVMR